MTSAQAAINAALAHQDPRDVVEAVKQAVAQELEGVSPRLEVRATDYFNHNYVPDLVAWWGPKDEDRREVFLRFDARAEGLVDDIRRLEPERPMFFSLEPRSNDEVGEPVRAALQSSPHVLVTSSPAVDALSGALDGSFEALVTTAVVQGGRGLVDLDVATAVRRSGADGVSAAVATDSARTLEAVKTVRRVLSDEPAVRVEKYLQTLWLAGGGALESYPGDQGLALDIGIDDIGSLLKFLFRQPAVTDLAFWQRLGERVDLDTLAGLGSIEPAPNLQALIQSNLERFQVSFASADPQEPRMAWTQQPFNWLITGGLLSLEGPEFLASFTTDGRSFRGRKAEHPLLAIEAVRGRAAGLRVEGLGLDHENLVITVETKDHEGRSDPSVFDDLASAIGRSPRVRSLHVRAGGRSMICHFDRRVVDVDDGRAQLPDVAVVAASVLTQLDPTVREELAEFLRVGPMAGRLELGP